MVVEIKVKIDRVSIDGVVGVNWNTDASGNIKRYNDQTRREECSEQLYRVIEAKPEKRTKGDENARALPLCANIQPFNVGPSASLTRCSIEKKQDCTCQNAVSLSLWKKKKKKKKKKKTGGTRSNKNFWNKGGGSLNRCNYGKKQPAPSFRVE